MTRVCALAVLSVLAAGVYFVNGEHGWVGEMVHHSSAAHESPHGHAAGGHPGDERGVPGAQPGL